MKTIKSPEQVAAEMSDGAIVFVTFDGDDRPMIRHAAFVYVEGDTLTWVEPSYSDPEGASSPSLHRRTGEIRISGDGLTVPEDFQLIEVGKYTPDIDEDLDGGALARFIRSLEAAGTSWGQERARIYEMIRST